MYPSQVTVMSNLKKQNNPWIIFSVVAMCTFMSTLDSSIVNVALPVITKSFNSGLNTAQWVITAYLLTISCLLPIFGRAGDMYGQRKILTLGMGVFIAGSSLCGLSVSIWMLIASRVVQAVGAAMMMSNGPGIIAAAFPLKERGRALGAIGTVVAIGSITGPGLGGIITGISGWEMIFFINIPVGVAAIIMGRMLLPKGINRNETFDFAGSILFALSIGSLLLALSSSKRGDWNSFYTIASLITGMTSIILFVYTEKKVRHPMLDLALFRNRPFLFGNISGLLSFMAMFTNAVLLPFFLSNIKNLPPSQVGLIITPFPLVLGITAPVSGYMSERIRAVYLTTTGLCITGTGLLLMSRIAPDTPVITIALIQALMGFGSGLFQSPNNNSVISSVPREKTGTAGGIGALMRNLGMVIGTASAVTIFESQRTGYLAALSAPGIPQKTAAFIHGFHSAIIFGAVIAFAAALISLGRKGYSQETK